MNVTQTGDGRARMANVRSRVGLVFWVLLVPIALFALGLWQSQRGAESLGRAEQSSTELSSTLAQVKDIAATDPTATLTFEGGSEPLYLSALVAVSQIQDALSHANEDLEISRIRAPLVWGTIGGAILAFLGGGVGLLAATISGVRARRSQSQLIRSFQRLRSILPFVLAAVVIGFCVGAISAVLFEAVSIGLWPDLSTDSAKLFVAAVILAVVAVYSAFMALRGLKQVFTLFTPEPLEVSGRIIGEAEAPELWRFVRNLAERQQALLPDTIIVGLTEGFFVTESQVRLWPQDKLLTGRSLYLPAPYLDLLDQPEITAIIGHEFAHFSGEDTRYSQLFTPIYAGFWRALNALRRADSGRFILYPAIKLGFHAVEQFDHAVGHWSRLRELDADRNGSMHGRPEDAGSALIRAGIISPAVAHILGRAHSAPEGDGATDLVAQTTELVRLEGWTDPVPLLEDRQPHPTDSHPPTIRRIAALGVSLDEALLARATRRPEAGVPSFAQSLFADWSGLNRLLSQDFIDAARKAQARRREVLEKAAAGVTGEVVLYDNVQPMIWTMGIISAILLAFGGVILFLPQQTGIGNDVFTQRLVTTIIGIGLLGCMAYAGMMLRGAAKPLMVLTPDSLISSRLDRPLAWTDIADYAVYASSRFALRLALNDGVAMPKKDWRAIYSKIDEKRRIVTLGALGIRGMKAVAFSELVHRYHHAAYARQALASRPAA